MRRKGEEVVKEKVLDIDADMQGTLSFNDPVNLRINGKFEGSLNTKGSLTISENAVVKADIIGESIIIAGKVTGNITATKEINLIPPALIIGDIQAPRLGITPGAVLEGNCRMISKGEDVVAGGEVLNVEDVAKYLEVEASVVEEWADAGKIPAQKRGQEWKFDKAMIDKWVADEKVKI